MAKALRFLAIPSKIPSLMDSLLLEVAQRNLSQKPKALRRSGFIPAVYYGQKHPVAQLQVKYQSFRKVFDKAGLNTIIELSLDGGKIPVLVHDIQYDPVSDEVSHVDFMHVDMEKEVTTNVKIIVVGIAPAVKNLGGILDVKKHEIKIKCLPKDLIHGIEIDVSGIVDFHTSVHVKDIKIPKTIKVLDNPDDTVVTATPPKIEKEETPPSAAAAAPTAEAGAAQAAPAAEGQAATGVAPAAQAGKEQKK